MVSSKNSELFMNFKYNKENIDLSESIGTNMEESSSESGAGGKKKKKLFEYIIHLTFLKLLLLSFSNAAKLKAYQ